VTATASFATERQQFFVVARLTANSQEAMLSASAITTTLATVSWGASTDDDGDSITYKVEYRRSGTTTWNSAGSTADISMALSGLDSDQAYDVSVTPNDGTDDGFDRTAPNLF